MFITFEGIEGSGKTTQIDLLASKLKAMGHESVSTREPGATKIGEKIRAILLDSAHDTMVPEAELLLYAADRAQHVHECIAPALAAKKVVISDRFFDATTVYQGYARGIDLDVIQGLHRLVLHDLKPDLSILLDLPVALGLERAWQRIKNKNHSTPEDRFEKEALAFHEKVRKGYLALAGLEPDRFRVIDASGDAAQVHERVMGVVSPILGH